MNVTPVNDAPVAQADFNTVDKAAPMPVTGAVLSNDSDPDGDPLMVTAVTGGTVGAPLVRSTGTLTLKSDGTYSFSVNTADPAVAALTSGQTLTETYTYTASDGKGGTATSTLTIVISGPNTAPHAVSDANDINEGGLSVSAPAASGTLINDNDPDGDPLTATGVAAGAGQPIGALVPVSGSGTTVSGRYGQLQLLPDGSYTYVLNNANPSVNALAVGETLNDRFTYAISDGKGGNASADIVITIHGQNDLPDAVDDTASVPANGPSVSSLTLLNDSDPDTSDTLTVTAVNGIGGNVGSPVSGTYGSLRVNPDGSYIYTPNATTAKALGLGETATDTFTYTISDGHGGVDTANITITLSGVNDIPVAQADINTLTENQANASGNVLSGSRTTGAGVTTANPGSADSDPDTHDTLVVSGVLSPSGVAASPGAPLPGRFGTLTLNPDGSYNYALNTTDPAVQALRPGETRNEVYTYTINDGKGGVAVSTLTIVVVGENDPPVAVDDHFDTIDTAGMPGGTPVAGNVLVNDHDPDAGTTLTVTSVTGTAVGTVGGSTIGTFGTLRLNPDGTFTYDVDQTNPVIQGLLAGDSRTDTFTYTISDGEGGSSTATVTITVHGTNNASYVRNDTNAINEDQASASGNVISGLRVTGSGVSSTVAASADTDPEGDPLAVSGIRRPDPGLLAGVVGSGYRGDYGSLTINGDGSYSYQLDNSLPAIQALKAGETISDVFVYTVNDGHGHFVDATLTIVITGTNDVPVVLPDTNTIIEGAQVPVTGAVLLNDSDLDHAAVLAVSGVGSGNLIVPPVGGVGTGVAGNFGTLILDAHGGYSYQLDNANPAVQALAAGATTTDTFTYAITDDQGASRFTTLTITILGVNNPPVAVADTAAINAGDSAVVGDLTPGGVAQDRDVDGDPIRVIGFANSGGAMGNVGSGSSLGAALPGSFGSLQVAADGSHRYVIDNTNPTVLALKDGQTVTETFTYTIADGQGGYATSTLTITISGRNDPPVAVNDGVLTTNEDVPLNNIPVLANDSDVDGDPVVVTLASSPQGTVTINPDGTLNFVPNANFHGPATITYTISDGHGGTATATVSINVVSVNDPPVAENDGPLTTNEDVPLNNIPVLVNDSDLDGDTLTVTSASSPQGTVTINPDGTLNFVPNPNYHGLATITYMISDGHGGTATATVSINVVSVNDPPVAVDDSGRSPDGRAVLLRPLENDSDLDNDTLTVSAIAGKPVATGSTVIVTGGTVRVNADGSLSFTPTPGFQGIAAFQYTISDGNGGTATATIRVDVTPAGEVFVVDTPRPVPNIVSPLVRDESREPSVFFDADTFTEAIRLTIPFQPAVFVNRVVQAAQTERHVSDSRGFSNPDAVRPPEIRTHSGAVGLGFDPVLFVQHAVRAAQQEGLTLDNMVDGRLSRVNLSSDWRIPISGFVQPDQRALGRSETGAPREIGQNAEREGGSLSGAKEKTTSRQGVVDNAVPKPRSAPSFSEQLRQAARPLATVDRSRVVQKP